MEFGEERQEMLEEEDGKSEDEEEKEEEKKEDRGWEGYFAQQYKSAATLKMYKFRIRKFCAWLAAQRPTRENPSANVVCDRSVSLYISSLASHPAKLQAVAALTARYNGFEGRELKFPKVKAPRG